MLLKYLVPVAGLVALQIILNSWGCTAQTDGEKDDLDSAELFLRPVVIKYGHDHPGIYTWQGGSGVGQGWGVYRPQAPKQTSGGWGKEKKKKKKKKKKAKKKKKPKKKKQKKKKKKEKKKKGGGGWGWSWGPVSEGNAGSSGYGGGGGGGGGGGHHGGGGGGHGGSDDDDDDDKGRIGRPIFPESVVARFGGPAVRPFIPADYEYDNGEEGFRNSYYPNDYNNY